MWTAEGWLAKAMIVTQSREHALRYYFGVRDHIKQQGYLDLRALVAFSGDLELDGQTYTEAELNSFSETELPSRFDGFKPDGTPFPQQYQVLIVAEKYQTGFDQPKLCAMYVDRKLPRQRVGAECTAERREAAHQPANATAIIGTAPALRKSLRCGA